MARSSTRLNVHNTAAIGMFMYSSDSKVWYVSRNDCFRSNELTVLNICLQIDCNRPSASTLACEHCLRTNHHPVVLSRYLTSHIHVTVQSVAVLLFSQCLMLIISVCTLNSTTALRRHVDKNKIIKACAREHEILNLLTRY